MPILTIDDDFLAQLCSAIVIDSQPVKTLKTVPLIECFSGEELGQLPQSTLSDVSLAFERARIAQEIWQKTSYDLRRRVFLRAHDAILREQSSLIDLVQAETGKSRGQAYEELFSSAATTRYLAFKARSVLAPKRKRSPIPVLIGTEVFQHPKGTIGVITPWNYPLSIAAFDVLPALISGNAVVQKIDNQAGLAVLQLRQIFVEAGLPPALWQVVAGAGATIGQAVVEAADYVAFTGSTPTGIGVAKTSAERLVGVSLELGGKNALLVLPDADPKRAAKIAAYSCFSSQGQLCVSTERIYLVGDVADAFEAAFVEELSRLKIGAGYHFDTDYGSLASAAQLKRLEEHVKDAVSKGATLLSGGVALPELGPFFFAPTVLKNVSEDMECFRTETFGPLVSLYRVNSVNEAITAANDSELGLNASILTDRPARAKNIAQQLVSGSVNINEGYRASFSSSSAPMGGVKKSGLGRRNGPEGILRYTNSQTVSVARRVISLPTTGREFRVLAPVMTLLLRILKGISRA
ncbi:MAG: succinic semialdehyde dehydrogenase [Microbacteriaceae bacterium]